MLGLHAVSFAYTAKTPILNQISLSFPLHQITGLCGQNGAGKSTLLKIIANIESHFTGTVDKSHCANIGYVAAEETCPFEFRVEDIVGMGRFPFLGWMGILSPHDKTVIHQVMLETGIIHLKDRMIHTLSSGEKQRVFLARALAQEPSFLLLDEPFTHLDLTQLTFVLNLIKTRHEKQGLGCLIVSHQLSILAEIASQIVFLKNGTVAAKGSPEEMLKPDIIHKVFDLEMII